VTQATEQARQEAVLAFLAKGADGPPTRVDTHASIVFLERDRVLKIKRAVRLPFLDYSTLDKRKHACEDELLVNRRLAPAIYRRVVPITRDESGLEIDGRGEIVEWAVEMARFDERQTLDHLAARGEITADLGEALAKIMLASHTGAPVSDGASWLQSIAGLIDHNTARFRTVAALARADVERLHDTSHRQMDKHFSLMQQRAAAGLVRRSHGDAHLGNIVLIDQKPVLFDAIEFDPVIATIDVLYDLAFPLMDLIHFGEASAANRLFNFYLRATWQENADALLLLPLFLSIRAAIRAHVLFTRHEQSPDSAVATQARGYFDLALLLISPKQPSLVAVGGRSGTGKSVLARSLAATFAPPPGALVLRSDVIRKELCGVDPLTALPERAYGPEMTTRVYDTMIARAATALRQGVSVVLDAAYLRAAERAPLTELASACGAALQGFFLDADIDVRLKRIAARGPDASDANREVALKQQTYDIGVLDWPVVDASGTPEQTLARAQAHLRP
jgi:aminoglycoside phosphotransferase family enzyme/predicted kinase